MSDFSISFPCKSFLSFFLVKSPCLFSMYYIQVSFPNEYPVYFFLSNLPLPCPCQISLPTFHIKSLSQFLLGSPSISSKNMTWLYNYASRKSVRNVSNGFEIFYFYNFLIEITKNCATTFYNEGLSRSYLYVGKFFSSCKIDVSIVPLNSIMIAFHSPISTQEGSFLAIK